MKRFLGCAAGLILFAGIIYALMFGGWFLWYGPGFGGAMTARHKPERLRGANVIHIYDHVITVERERVVFRRSLWASIRWMTILGLAGAIAAYLATRRRVMAAIAFALIAIATSAFTRKPPVIVTRGDPRPVVMRTYDVGGGRSGTRMTTPLQTGYDILIGDTVLVRLPWNEEKDAKVWREIVEKKVRKQE
jgi:hypothetical protein